MRDQSIEDIIGDGSDIELKDMSLTPNLTAIIVVICLLCLPLIPIAILFLIFNEA